MKVDGTEIWVKATALRSEWEALMKELDPKTNLHKELAWNLDAAPKATGLIVVRISCSTWERRRSVVETINRFAESQRVARGYST